jgi:hypothetical protein
LAHHHFTIANRSSPHNLPQLTEYKQPNHLSSQTCSSMTHPSHNQPSKPTGQPIF